MIGIEILTWGTEGEVSPYYYPLYHYLWGGSVGHSAIKLTIPCEPRYDEWVSQYCCDKTGKSLIPHYRLARQNVWVVYFSWWPEALQEEYEDRMEANSGLCVEYEKKWQPHFTETVPQKTGMLRYKLGKIYDWFFGSPQEIPKPIQQIVHPHPQAQLLSEQLANKEADLRGKNYRLLPFLEDYIRLVKKLELLTFKINYVELFGAANEAERGMAYDEMLQTYKVVTQKLKSIETTLLPLLEARDCDYAELKALRRYFYEEVATVGCEPQRVCLPLDYGLSAEKMLKSMHGLASTGEPFDKIFNNCSTVVRQIMAEGLDERINSGDRAAHLFDTPFKIHRFACDLQKKLINLRQQAVFVPQYRAAAAHLKQTPESKKFERTTARRPSYS